MSINPNDVGGGSPWGFVANVVWRSLGALGNSSSIYDLTHKVVDAARRAQVITVPQVITAGGFGRPQGAVDVSGPTRPVVIDRGGTIGQSGALPSRAPPSADTIPGPRRKGPIARYGRKKLKLPKGGNIGALLYVLAESVSQTATDDVIGQDEYDRRFGGKGLEEIKVRASRIAYPRPLTPVKVTARRIPERPLTPVKVTARRLPRVPAPRSTRQPLWMRALPYVVPLLTQRLQPQPKFRLTVSNPAGAPLPQPQPQPQPRPQPQPQPLPGLASYSNYGGFVGTSSSSCECPPKRKRKPKSKRTICYSGTYSDKANGLRKTKKRKIPCK